MKNIKVLGSGCAKCKKAAEQIQKIASEMEKEVTVTKESDPQTIMEYGVMSTPAIVIDEQLVHSGSIPHTNQIKEWLSS